MKEKRARRKYFVAAIKYVTWRRKQASDLNPDFQDQSLLAKNSDDKMWRKQDARHYIIRPQHNKCLGFVWRENAIETPVLHLQREKLAAAGSLRKQLFTSCIQDISFFKYIIRWSKKIRSASFSQIRTHWERRVLTAMTNPSGSSASPSSTAAVVPIMWPRSRQSHGQVCFPHSHIAAVVVVSSRCACWKAGLYEVSTTRTMFRGRRPRGSFLARSMFCA